MKLTGWTLEQIDATPAVVCDWLLEIDDVVQVETAKRTKPKGR